MSEERRATKELGRRVYAQRQVACAIPGWLMVLVLIVSSLAPAFRAGADEVSDLEERLARLSGTERLPLIASLVEAYETGDAERVIPLALEGLEFLEKVPDALVELELLLSLAVAYAHTNNLQEALRYGKRAEELARAEGAPSQLATALDQVGSIQSRLNDTAGALDAFQEAEVLYRDIGDPASRAEAIRSSGKVYFRQGEHERASKEFLRALGLHTELGDELGKARALNNIGSVYSRLRQSEKALAAFRETLIIYRRLELPAKVAGVLSNIGLMYLRTRDPSRATDHFRQAIDAMEGIDDDRLLGAMYQNLGQSLRDLGQLQQSMSYLQRSLEIKERLGNRRGRIDILIALAGVHRLMGNSDTALSVAEQARDAALELDSRIDLENAYEELARIHTESGRYRQALEAFQQQKELHEDIYNERNSEIIAEMTARYESERKQTEIQRLKTSQLLANLELQRRQSQQRALLVGSVGFILLVLGLAYAGWQRRTVVQERDINRRLLEVDKLKDEFLANTSHELRTPLYGITGIAESLIDGATGELPETTKENLEMVVASGRRLSHLVNDILDFSKLRHKSLELDRRPVELHALIDVVLTLSTSLVGSKDIRLENAMASDLPPADADENRLQQIFYNLIGNAIKFTEEGRVEVSAAVADDLLVVRVADTGIGIPEDEQERIFDAFEQADASIEREYGGTGLGLAVTRQLVELHGGTIDLESVPGAGSTFSFSLPIAAAAADRADELEASRPVAEQHPILEHSEPTAAGSVALVEPSADAPRVLVVDDEPVNLQVVRNYLGVEDFDLTLASSGEQALRLLEKETFDLMLLDIMMPRMSGYEVCRSLREHLSISDLPVIFLTAKTQDSDLVAGMALGANDYLAKPISKDRLLARVRPHLDLLQIHRNLENLVEEKMAQVKVLSGLLPICSGCKKIRDDEGYWGQLETFIDRHSEASFSHGICPDCLEHYYGEHPELRRPG